VGPQQGGAWRPKSPSLHEVRKASETAKCTCPGSALSKEYKIPS